MRNDGCVCEDIERWHERCLIHREADSDAPGVIVLTIRRTADGSTRSMVDIWRYSIDGMHYQYGDGNYACDDNREIFFARAGSEPFPTDVPCSQGRYAIAITSAATGETLFDDGVWSDEPVMVTARGLLGSVTP